MAYVLDVVFHEWFGLHYVVESHGGSVVEIVRGSKTLALGCPFFHDASGDWLGEATLPALPLERLRIDRIPDGVKEHLKERVPDSHDGMPVLYGNPVIRVDDDGKSCYESASRPHMVHCGVDILGSIFFMLSRYEEAVLPDRDEHDRFPARASVVHRAGFLDRPIVNEYVELLWAMMAYLWLGLERKSRRFRMLVSHDVDSPFAYARLPLRGVARRVVGDVVKRRSPRHALSTWKVWNASRSGRTTDDPHNTFGFIMTESERRGLKSAFYFISDHTAGAIDGQYTLDDPEIVLLLREIASRGHEIGLHTSYCSYRDPNQTARETQRLQDALQRHGLAERVRGGRQHYLRWQTPQTFRNWDAAGLEYDSTLSYADCAGFRCGTCWEYPAYDVVERRELALRERPLVAMEVTVIAEKYMGLGYSDAAFGEFSRLKATCRAYNGDFTLLWHNTQLLEPEAREVYLAVLDA